VRKPICFSPFLGSLAVDVGDFLRKNMIGFQSMTSENDYKTAKHYAEITCLFCGRPYFFGL
jgi:hypothetical protein